MNDDTSATRSCFRADPDAPAAEFEAEADLYPVFRFTAEAGTGG